MAIKTALLLICLVAMQGQGNAQALDSKAASGREVRVAILAGPSQAPKLRETLERFTKESGIRVTTLVRGDLEYKEALVPWLIDEQDTPDVLYWQSSQRLFYFAEKGVLSPLTSLWKEQGLDSDFSHVKSSLVYKGDIWGIPISYFHWGIYYKKSVIAKYGAPPRTWAEMLEMADRMKKDGISPFGLGNKELWPAAAWFDYFNMRIHGLNFHMQLLEGKVSFKDPRVKRVVLELKRLVDKKYFDPVLLDAGYGDVAPMLRRGQIGFTLMSNGITARLPEESIPEIGFIPFPEIVPGNNFEDGPLDVLMLPKKVLHRAEAEEFLKFMARPDIQTMHNNNMGYLPPNRRSQVNEGTFMQEGADLLRSAKGVAQFFDRDTIPAFDKAAMPILGEFIRTGNSETFIAAMERSRLAVFPAKK